MCGIFSGSKITKRTKIQKKNIKEKVEEEDDNITSINDTDEYNKNIFSIVDFPERITQINKAHPVLKKKEKIVLNQILESLKKERQKDSKQYFNELSKIRKDLSTLETSKKVMEQTSIKLSLIHDISDTLDVLGPILKEEKEEKGKENKSNEEKTENKDREGMNTFVKTMTEDILKNNYKEIDIQSIDEIDKVFKKIITYKENK